MTGNSRTVEQRAQNAGKAMAGVLLIILLFMASYPATAGRYGAPVDPNYDQTLTPALSAGMIDARDAVFAGITVNYGQLWTPKWSWNAALAWDNEKSTVKRSDNGGNGSSTKRVNTFTVIGSLGYTISNELDISFGAGLGIADDDNDSGDLKFTDNGDFSVGSSLGWSFWQRGARRANLSTSLEYNLSQNEPSISFDLGYGISF